MLNYSIFFDSVLYFFSFRYKHPKSFERSNYPLTIVNQLGCVFLLLLSRLQCVFDHTPNFSKSQPQMFRPYRIPTPWTIHMLQALIPAKLHSDS